MIRTKLTVLHDGFSGEYYKAPEETNQVFIVLLGDKAAMIKSAAKWLHKLHCNVLGFYPIEKQDTYKKFANFELERFNKAIQWLRSNGNNKIGITGGSTWGMLALVAASFIPDITMTMVFTPADFVMQGFYQGRKEGMKEWPAVDQPTISWKGKSLSYQPFYLSEHAYWNSYHSATKKYREPHTLQIFQHSEQTSPIPETAFIKVEHINGPILFAGANDDSMWETTKYISRMKQRLEQYNFSYPFICKTYQYGTHFIYPEGMMKKLLPIGGDLLSCLFSSGRVHRKECKATRIDLQQAVEQFIQLW